MKLIYPFIKYIESIDKKKANELKIYFGSLIDNKKYEFLYKVILNDLEEKNLNKIYKIRNILDENSKSYLPFHELSFEPIFLDKYYQNENVVSKNEWNLYIDKVVKIIKENKDNNFKLYNLCMKYLSNIPAVNSPNCDISLFDVCKMYSALANCMEKDKENFILIKGDFSGIQKFIYKTKKDAALKTLKGRSLYLTLLQDLSSKYIIRELGLDISNVLYSGGGNFYIIASQKDIGKFILLKKRLNEVTLNAHEGEIYLSLAYTEFKIDDLNNFSEIWREIGNKIGNDKNSKWSELGLDKEFNKIFGPIDAGGKLEDSCSICGFNNHSVNEGNCSFCNSFIGLVDHARNKHFYIEEIVDISDTKDTYNDIYEVFESLGYKIEFTNEPYKTKENQLIYSINDFKHNDVDGFTFKSVKFNSDSLDDISKTENELGDKKIGVLKLDVDNLGKLFIQTSDIRQVMGLSRAISLFFEGFVEQIIFNNKNMYYKENNLKTISNWKGKITVIYAGGDDTFVVGRYDELFEFTYALREIFRKYTSSYKKTFSAGVGMFNPTFPILQTASITEGFLEKAKEKDDRKDKIAFMGEVFTWEQFLDLIKLKNKIQTIYYKTTNKALFEKINNSTKGFKSIFKKGNNNINYVKVYKLAYYLRDLKNSKDEELESLVEDLINGYENLCLACIRNEEVEKNAMIIPYANKWAQSNCRKVEKESDNDGISKQCSK